MKPSPQQALFLSLSLLLAGCADSGRSPPDDAASAGRVDGTITLTGQADHGGILVAALGTERSAFTDVDGRFSLDALEPGPRTLEARRTGFRTGRFLVTVPEGGSVTIEESLEVGGMLEPGMGVVSGNVKLLGRSAHDAVKVTLSGGSSEYTFETTSNTDGDYVFTEVPEGVYSLAFESPPFHPRHIDNVITGSGTLKVAPVVLRVARPVDERVVTSARFAPKGGRAVLKMSDSIGSQTVIYDAETDSFREVADLSAISFTDAGDVALVQQGNALQKLDIATGALSRISPLSTQVVQVEKGRVYYQTSEGNLAVWSPDTGDAKVVVSETCLSAYWHDYGNLLNPRWVRLRRVCSGGYASFAFLFDGKPLPTLGLVREDVVSPDGQFALMAEVDDPSRPTESTYTIKRVNLETGKVEVVGTKASGFSSNTGSVIQLSADWIQGSFRHSIDAATGRASYAAFDPKSGVAKTLVEDATLSREIAKVGAIGDVYVVRFDLKTASFLCEGPDAVVSGSTNIRTCTSSGRVSAYVKEDDSVVELSKNGAVLAAWIKSVIWSDTVANKAMAWAPGLGASVTLCEPANSAPFRLLGRYFSEMSTSYNGLVWAYTCDNILSLVDLSDGTTKPIVGPVSVDSFATCFASDAASVVCTGVSSTSAEQECDATACVSTLNDGDSVSFAFLPLTDYAAWMGSIWSEDGSTVIGSPTSGTWYVARFPAGQNPIVRSLDALKNESPVVGSDGLFALWKTSDGWSVNDLVTEASTAIGGDNAPLRIGTSSHYAVGDSVVDLATGVIHALKGQVAGRAVSNTGVLTYRDASTGDLWKYTGGASTLIAPSTSSVDGSSTLRWSEAGNGTLSLGRFDAETATFTVLVANALRRFDSIGGNRGYIFRDADAEETNADLVVLNLADATLVDLNARVSLRGEPIVSSASNVLFAGGGPDGKNCLYLARLDGGNTTCLPGPSRTYSFLDAERTLFESAGVMWLADGVSPPVALERAGGFKLPFLRDDGKLLLLPVSLPGELPARVGTFRMDLTTP